MPAVDRLSTPGRHAQVKRLIEGIFPATLEPVPRTRTTQVNRFEQLELMDAREEPNIGFSTSLLSQLAWAVDDPGPVERWSRRNGKYLLIIQPGSEPDSHGGLRTTGVPFGVIPRYLNLWVCTEIKQTGEPELILGDSLAGFMRKLGLRNSGGNTGTRGFFKDQLNRWLNASISFIDVTKDSRYENSRVEIKPSDGYRLLWADGPEGKATELRGQSKIMVSPRFFTEVMDTYIPVDLDAVRALKGSAVRIDLFMWLNWRIFQLNRQGTPKVLVPWETLRAQFGTTDADDKDARYNFKRLIQKHLVTIKNSAWPELAVSTTPEGVELKPCLPQLPSKGMRKFYLEQRRETADVRYAAALAADKDTRLHRAPTSRPRKTTTKCDPAAIE